MVDNNAVDQQKLIKKSLKRENLAAIKRSLKGGSSGDALSVCGLEGTRGGLGQVSRWLGDKERERQQLADDVRD